MKIKKDGGRGGSRAPVCLQQRGLILLMLHNKLDGDGAKANNGYRESTKHTRDAQDHTEEAETQGLKEKGSVVLCCVVLWAVCKTAQQRHNRFGIDAELS